MYLRCNSGFLKISDRQLANLGPVIPRLAIPLLAIPTNYRRYLLATLPSFYLNVCVCVCICVCVCLSVSLSLSVSVSLSLSHQRETERDDGDQDDIGTSDDAYYDKKRGMIGLLEVIQLCPCLEIG